jgi:hypothetical protein
MATKNIARTIIEGGRTGYNKGERRGRMAELRAANRAFVDRARRDPDAVLGGVTPVRQRVRKEFEDKLGPARRWLARQVGRRWDSVYADLRARFDTRTTAGRHIVFDHMLPWVTRADQEVRWRGDFIVDLGGILREEQRSARRRWRRESTPKGTIDHPHAEIETWRAQRKIGIRGSVAFWFVKTTTDKQGNIRGWRQDVRLDAKELAFLATLVPREKQEIHIELDM